MREFLLMYQELGVPIAQEKTEGPSTSLVYLGYLLDTTEFKIRIPEEKIKNLLDLIQNTLSRKKTYAEGASVYYWVPAVLCKSNAISKSLYSSYVWLHVNCQKSSSSH